MKKLSRRQEEVLSCIRDHIDRTGISPSYAEIARSLSFSPQAAHDAVMALVRKGMLEKGGDTARSIVLSAQERMERENIAVPLFPSEPCADQLDGDSETGQWIYERKAIADSMCFAFRVTSESMKDGGIIPGDIAVMTRDVAKVRNGNIVLASSGDDGEAMELRRYHKLPGYTLLIPDNEIMGERKSISVTVYGILVAIRREYP